MRETNQNVSSAKKMECVPKSLNASSPLLAIGRNYLATDARVLNSGREQRPPNPADGDETRNRQLPVAEHRMTTPTDDERAVGGSADAFRPSLSCGNRSLQFPSTPALLRDLSRARVPPSVVCPEFGPHTRPTVRASHKTRSSIRQHSLHSAPTDTDNQTTMATDSGSSVFDSLVEDHTALMQSLSKKLTVLSSKGDGASVQSAAFACACCVFVRCLVVRLRPADSVLSATGQCRAIQQTLTTLKFHRNFTAFVMFLINCCSFADDRMKVASEISAHFKEATDSVRSPVS